MSKTEVIIKSGGKDKTSREEVTKDLTKEMVMDVIKEHIKELLKPYVPYTDLVLEIRRKFPGTEESRIGEVIGILKNEKKLDEARIRRARLLFPVAMIKLYLASSQG